MECRLAIFDLDGVLTDTAKYHYLAWRELAAKLNYTLSEEQNEELKGVSRIDSLNRILHWAGLTAEDVPFEDYLEDKNRNYLRLIDHMDETELFEGVVPLLTALKQNEIKIALGSSSKNARFILDKLGITSFFDVVGDGNSVTQSKPAPDIFLYASDMCGVAPEHCLVFEDAPAGVDAARAASMPCIGIGDPKNLQNAHICIPHISAFNLEMLKALSN